MHAVGADLLPDRALHRFPHVPARVRLREEVPAGAHGVDHVERKGLVVQLEIAEGTGGPVIEVVVEQHVFGREQLVVDR